MGNCKQLIKDAHQQNNAMNTNDDAGEDKKKIIKKIGCISLSYL